jgi:hypothetical protein
MKLAKLIAMLALLGVVLLQAPGCSKEESEEEGNGEKAKAAKKEGEDLGEKAGKAMGETGASSAAVDMTDPNAVIAAFVKAVEDQDTAAMRAVAAANHADELAEEFAAEGWPTVPASWRAEAAPPGEDDDTRNIDTDMNWLKHFRLYRKRGKWYMGD